MNTMESPLIYILVAVVLILVLALGTISWYTIQLLFHGQTVCKDSWEKALTNCKKEHIPRPEIELFNGVLKSAIDKVELAIDKIHERINDIPGDIKTLFDGERKHSKEL